MPTRALPAPNMMANPTAQKASEAMVKSIKFFIRMFTTFLAACSPASSRANPACMKNTRHAANSTQMVSIATCSAEGPATS